jgi:8-oxo-dGTP diphosphatase
LNRLEELNLLIVIEKGLCEKMELWDVYNINRVRTGKTIVRGEMLSEGEYHLVVHMWIINSKGQFLIQKRSSGVKSSPNMWAITGGAALAGDDSYTACKREVLEEIGIQADLEKAKVVFTVTRLNSICDVWVIRQDFELVECTLQKEEVSEVKWATYTEIRKMQDQGVFHQYRYFEELIRTIGNEGS